MKRLLKRRQVQVTLEETEKEMGGQCLSINELEILLNEEGIDTKITSIPTRQIASNENTHFLLVKNVKEAMKQAVEREAAQKDDNQCELPSTSKSKDDLGLEYDEDLEAAIKLSLEADREEIVDLTEKSDVASSSHVNNCKQIENSTIVSDISKNSDLALAKAYMIEYSGLSEYEVDRILKDQSSDKTEEKIVISHNLNDENIELVNEKQLETSKPQNPTVNVIKIDENVSENVIYTEKIVDAELNKLEDNHDKFSSSDSDDSFEEVPELDKTKSNIPNNDIFAEVFSDKSKFQDLDKNILSKLKKSEEIAVENSEPATNIAEKDFTNEVTEHDESIEKIMEVIEKDIVIKIEQESEEEIFDESQPSPQSIHESDNSTFIESEPSTSVNDSNPPEIQTVNPIMKEMFTNLEKDLEQQKDILEKEQNKMDRMGRNITEEMAKDAQGLLRLFGIPYIVAPMEAEAQCAFLESINLTDGTITDDSDIWLFGGKTVYRNFFNQQKHVIKFSYENIIRSFSEFTFYFIFVIC